MNISVKYFSRSGNTRRLAEAIAVEACELNENGADEQADVLFLGASVYWNGIDGVVRAYIDSLNPEKVKQVIVFSTSALVERAFPEIEKRLSDRGISVHEKNFYCRGQFLAMHKNRPNKNDIEAAGRFARDILSVIQ